GVNSAHHQAVARIAEPLEVTGRGEDGVVESMELKAEARCWLPFLLSVQFHPERMTSRSAEHQAIFRAFAAACVLNRKKAI
ncbi:MAG TPA: gamma-glutamyl-gamma-aminobutyrate hydrolase family protein, partial [Verrucomicrobiae bacterium]|nr:gamma-glutamyl-gamma-aminobutyrate hydrolase family protein [Verrucomicrobiae bacterium]